MSRPAHSPVARALSKGGGSRSCSSLGSVMSRSSQRGQMGSHQKPVFMPPSREPIPDLSKMPPLQEHHARLRSKLRRSQSTVDLSTPGHDRHAACKYPRSVSKDSPRRPDWDDRTQIVYPRPGSEFHFPRLFGSLRKKAQAEKKEKRRKGLAESEAKNNGDSKNTAEACRQARRFASVPDLTLLESPPGSPEAVKDASKAGGLDNAGTALDWFLQKLYKTPVSKKQDLKDLCRSLDVMPLPTDDTASQAEGLNIKEEQLRKTKPKPEPQSSSEELPSACAKKSGPKEWRKGLMASMGGHRKKNRHFSPRPNKQGKEAEKKASVKRNILSSLSNVTKQSRENSTKPGSSQLRRAVSALNVMGAGSRRQPKASASSEQAGQPPSHNKENKRE